MTNTLEILEVLKVDGETMYLLEGNIKAREIDILEFALHGTNFILSEDVEYVAMDYVEVFHSLDGGNEIDIYVHDVLITHDNDTEIDSEGRLIKTYLRESSAMKFANSLNTTKVITSN